MKNKKILTLVAIIVPILLIILVITSTTQAYFNRNNYAKNPTEYQTGLLLIEAVSKSNNISLSNTLPMSDTEGEQTDPYVFTIRNNGNVDYKFNIKLLSTSDNTISPEYIKIKIDDEGVKTLSSLTDSIIKEDVILPAGETIDITLRAWLSSDTKNTEIGKTFNSKIVIDGQSIYTSTNQEVPDQTIYTLTIKGETGVKDISYKTEGDLLYTTAINTSTVTIDAISGKTYYYYGTPSTGYVMSSCIESNPCTVTIGTNAVTKTITATQVSSDSYIVTIYKKVAAQQTELGSFVITSGNSFTYDFAKNISNINDLNVIYTYSSVACKNNQIPIISDSTSGTNVKTLKINKVTANTECILTYTSAGTVIS